MAHLPDSYTYPAILQKTNGHYSVYFPDLPGCIATRATADEAFAAAKEGLALHLWGIEQDGETIPQPSAFDTLSTKQGDVLCLLDANMFSMRAEMNNRPVKKTLTIPWYLNELAERQRLNFSQILQTALRERLSVQS